MLSLMTLTMTMAMTMIIPSMMTLTRCKSAYAELGTTVTEKQICAGGEWNKVLMIMAIGDGGGGDDDDSGDSDDSDDSDDSVDSGDDDDSGDGDDSDDSGDGDDSGGGDDDGGDIISGLMHWGQWKWADETNQWQVGLTRRYYN